jgi:hypothetical protein
MASNSAALLRVLTDYANAHFPNVFSLIYNPQSYFKYRLNSLITIDGSEEVGTSIKSYLKDQTWVLIATYRPRHGGSSRQVWAGMIGEQIHYYRERLTLYGNAYLEETKTQTYPAGGPLSYKQTVAPFT